jgi:hypothetical protein
MWVVRVVRTGWLKPLVFALIPSAVLFVEDEVPETG